jgi:hypothetical protein
VWQRRTHGTCHAAQARDARPSPAPLRSDTRLGHNGMTTISTEFQKIFKMHDRLFVGLTGLASDVLSL